MEAVNEATNVLNAAEKFVIQNKNILSADERLQLEKLTLNLKESLKSADKDDIEGAMKNLNEYSLPLAHRAFDVNIGKALKGVKVE